MLIAVIRDLSDELGLITPTVEMDPQLGSIPSRQRCAASWLLDPEQKEAHTCRPNAASPRTADQRPEVSEPSGYLFGL